MIRVRQSPKFSETIHTGDLSYDEKLAETSSDFGVIIFALACGLAVQAQVTTGTVAAL